jgi:hypothetical protein
MPPRRLSTVRLEVSVIASVVPLNIPRSTVHSLLLSQRVAYCVNALGPSLEQDASIDMSDRLKGRQWNGLQLS